MGAAFIFLQQKFQHIWVSLDANFNESLTNVVVSFEQLGPDVCCRARRGPVCCFIVFWLQIAVESFTLFHHYFFYYLYFPVMIRGGSNEYKQYIFWAELWKISEFYLKTFSFWWWNFNIFEKAWRNVSFFRCLGKAVGRDCGISLGISYILSLTFKTKSKLKHSQNSLNNDNPSMYILYIIYYGECWVLHYILSNF